MSDAMVTEATGGCVAVDGDCGSSAAIPFFISFQAREASSGFSRLPVVVRLVGRAHAECGGERSIPSALPYQALGPIPFPNLHIPADLW